MLHSTTVAGLRVTTATTSEVLTELEQRITRGEKTRIVTPYSEFLARALSDQAFLALLNSADLSLADGVAIAWADTFLRQPIQTRNRLLAYCTIWAQVVKTGLGIMSNRASVHEHIPETIRGSEFVYDLCALAERLGKPVFIAGGFGEVPNQAAAVLKELYPKLHIAGTSNARVANIESTEAQALAAQIRSSNTSFLFLALGPQKQEAFMMRYWQELEVDVAIGLGGTFEYMVGRKKTPPRWLRKLGLEWLFRLITEPKRIKRIYTGTAGLVFGLVHYKLETWTKQRPAGTL